ncbi:hypothetical protein VC83_03037 [Pseudogymnoascus destructans]|uniref:Rieske domain-containing protein n=1 Tax=Pseudogymnoascus destructans TaxID=655981 RepID=A0A177ACY3_9PEZI|nr:uncharacterized protein VC83_03037 [Pseudogymnoascus destructans]OAF59965.1 hypothetical protein VC83_03037 [Pseudogymnoascus destructans]
MGGAAAGVHADVGRLRLGVKPGEKREVEVDGVEEGKVLLLNVAGKTTAVGAKCTHYGAPLVKGVLTGDGRITCPWHGACFNAKTGEIENAPALDNLPVFGLVEKDGGVYVTGAIGTVEALREQGYKGSITLISNEGYLPIDRTKLSKALIADPVKIGLRDQPWFDEAGITTVTDEVTEVDFLTKKVHTKSASVYPYTKLVLATGGTPRQLPLQGFKELGNIFVLRNIHNVKDILAAIGEKNKKIVVIGSSFIGMEVAKATSKDNSVSVVGMEKVPLERYLKGNKSVQLARDGSLTVDENFLVQGLNAVYAVGDIATYPYYGPGSNGALIRIEHWNVAQNSGRAAAATSSRQQRRASGSSPSSGRRWGRSCGGGGGDDGEGSMVSHASELMRRGGLPKKAELEGGLDILTIEVPAL